jgi:acetyl-CoA C-acetyltransferase
MLKRTGLTMQNIDYHEINEAFSAVTLANIKLLDLDQTRVNVNGGAVALGHPLGMSGARIILSLINVLR